jgi:hypothetical protein
LKNYLDEKFIEIALNFNNQWGTLKKKKKPTSLNFKKEISWHGVVVLWW